MWPLDIRCGTPTALSLPGGLNLGRGADTGYNGCSVALLSVRICCRDTPFGITLNVLPWCNPQFEVPFIERACGRCAGCSSTSRKTRFLPALLIRIRLPALVSYATSTYRRKEIGAITRARDRWTSAFDDPVARSGPKGPFLLTSPGMMKTALPAPEPQSNH